MKKHIIAAMLAAVASAAAIAAPVLDRLTDQVILEQIGKSMPVPLEAVYKTEMKGFYEVHTTDKSIFYTNDEGKFFIVNGQMVDFATKTNFTQERKSIVNIVDWSKLPLDKAIVVKKGNGERKIAVFTDPDCPYCKRFEADLKTVDNVTVYYFMMPIDKLHPMARAKSISTWCSSDKAKTWNDMMLNNVQPEQNTSCAHPIDEIRALSSRLRINSTPTLINGKGQIAEGAIKGDRLDQFLNAK